MSADNVFNPSEPVGSVYLPAGAGTPVGKFEFLVDPDNGSTIEIGTMVTAHTDEGAVVGVVVDMRTVGTDSDPVSADISRRPGEKLGYFPAVRCAQVQVLSSGSLRPVGAGVVHAATEQEVKSATNQDKMDWPIPIGVISLADGSHAPVCVDGNFVLGPEAQGLSVFGRSGVASKTSFMSVALRSALNSGNEFDHRVGALVFNVKGTDLTSLDMEPEESKALTDEDRAIYAAMGLDATPFQDVTNHAVPVLDGGPTSTQREDALALSWDLRMVWPYIGMFFNVFEDDKLAAFVAQFEDNLLRHPNSSLRVDSFEKLERWFNDEISAAEESGSDYIWRNLVHIATARRLRRMFSGLHARGKGLFAKGVVKDTSRFDVPTSGWRHGQMRVVDIAGLPSEVQGFCIARTVDRIMRAAERGELGVDHLVVLTDELNAWAPSGSAREVDRVRKSLQKVATQGRYAGVSLFGAAQAASKIDDLLRDNCATKAVGSSAEAELTSGVHGRMPGGLVERVATLPKGQMMLFHTAFRQAVVVTFPRPAWLMGRSKTTGGAKPTVQSVLREHLGDKAYAKVTKGLDDDQIAEIASAGGDIAGAVDSLANAAEPSTARIHEPRDVDPNNPFDLD